MNAKVTQIRPGVDWRNLASCRKLSDADDLFFGLDGETPDFRDKREAAAKQICDRCPVRLRCALDAIEGEITHGVFGGLGERERADLIRASRLERAS